MKKDLWLIPDLLDLTNRFESKLEDLTVAGQREYSDTEVGSRLGMISPGVDLVMMLVVRPRTWTGIDCSG